MTPSQAFPPNSQRKICYAVVGLGWFAQAAALTAFAQAENSKLVALVSDDLTKREELAQQYGIQHAYFSDCILQDKDPEPSGVEGLNDIRIIRALYQSIETGTFVRLDSFDRHQRHTPAQTIMRPPAQEKPDLIHAADPSGKS